MPGGLCPAGGGEFRINVKLREADGQETAFNGEGPQIPPQGVQQLLAKLGSLTAEDVLVLSGSLPKGLPSTAFPQILEAARRSGARLVVDMAGDALLAALPYHPFLIKPNDEELCQLFGVEGPLTALEAKEYAQQLQHMGARNVVVSLGVKGALLAQEGGPACSATVSAGRLFPRWARGIPWWQGSSMDWGFTAPWKAA